MSISALAQNPKNDTSISGKVTDQTDGAALIGVSIYIPELKTGTVTDNEGLYFIGNLPLTTLTIQVSYLGHQTIIKSIDLKTTNKLDFVMKESNATINESVVVGLSGSSLMKDTPSPISYVSNRDLQENASSNIVDAISKQPGVSQITTGSGISKPVIRGLGYNRIVVVNNGVRQEGQQWGDEHGIEIDAQSIHSAEILKGPASLMYGSDAMAGVIIFHEDPIMPLGTIRAKASGEYQSNDGLLGYSVDLAGNQHRTVWDWRYSEKMAHDYKNGVNGFVYGSRYREQALSGLMGIQRRWGYSHLTLSYYHLIPGIVEGETNNQNGSRSYGRSLPYQQIGHYKAVWDNSLLIGNGSLNFILGYQQNHRQEFEDEDNPDQCGLDFLLHTVNYDLHYITPSVNGWKTVAGINGMYQKSVNKGSEFLIPAYNLFDFGTFATINRTFAKVNVSGGLRYDHRDIQGYKLEEDGAMRFNDFDKAYNGLTGSIGSTLNVTDKLNLKLNLSRGFRSPNISELASNGVHEGTLRYETGNNKLKPEYSLQLDFGVTYSSPVLSTQLSLFANRIDNYIFAEKLNDGTGTEIITNGVQTYQFRAGNARILGGEYTIDIHPVERMHFENDFSYVNSVQLHQPDESKYLPFTPAPRYLSTLKYDLIRDGNKLNNTFISVQMDCNFKQDHFYAANNTETATAGYTLFNASVGTDILSRRKKVASLFFVCNNITDKTYQSHLSRLKNAGIDNMGRNFCVKLAIEL